MKIALIDLGSNTIKMSVYEQTGQDFNECFYDASYAHVIGHVSDGQLSEQGIEAITACVSRYRALAGQMSCDRVICFSTASLRYIENQAEVIDRVLRQTGVAIRPISGEQEAECNFLSMQRQIKANRFLGGDIGGGSMQLFFAQNGSLDWHQSFPLGALKLYKEFVAGDIPTPDEAEQIRRHVLRTLADAVDPACRQPIIYFMGGTPRLIAALLQAKDGLIEADALNARLDRYTHDPALAAAEINALQPERLHVAPVCMSVLSAVCSRFQSAAIRFSETSVREGYLLKYCRE